MIATEDFDVDGEDDLQKYHNLRIDYERRPESLTYISLFDYVCFYTKLFRKQLIKQEKLLSSVPQCDTHKIVKRRKNVIPKVIGLKPSVIRSRAFYRFPVLLHVPWRCFAHFYHTSYEYWQQLLEAYTLSTNGLQHI